MVMAGNPLYRLLYYIKVYCILFLDLIIYCVLLLYIL